MHFISYAQNGEDILLNRVFADVANGFYVDIGAYEPVEGSVTKAFSDRGWTGINIEPGEVFHRLAAARPRDVNLHMAVLDRGGTVTFVEHAIDAGQSHVVQGPELPIDGVAHEVPCDTLAAILTAHAPERTIDFLKIDAEGAEAAIICSTNWRAIRPTVLVIEATYPWSNQLANADWEPVLLAHGYKRVWFDGINCFYVPMEREDLPRHFVLPINVIDHWAPFDSGRARLEAQRDSADAELKVVRTEMEATDAHLSAAQARESELASALSGCATELALVRTEMEATDAHLSAAQARESQLASALSGCATELAAERENGRRLATRAALLDKLVGELLWPDGPAALRTVLPLARLLRRIARTPVPAASPGLVSGGPTSLSSSPVVQSQTGAPRAKAAAKRLARELYRLVRPILRPIAWRTRAFMAGDVRAELAQLETKLDRISAALSVKEAPPTDARELVRMLETTLLTLALDRRRDGE
jgi:FkbM family methyltransferase